jgi:hypothetical protein
MRKIAFAGIFMLVFVCGFVTVAQQVNQVEPIIIDQFRTGRAEIKPEMAPALDRAAAVCKTHKCVIQGWVSEFWRSEHFWSRGYLDKQIALAKKRAENVASEQLARGVPADNLTIEVLVGVPLAEGNQLKRQMVSIMPLPATSGPGPMVLSGSTHLCPTCPKPEPQAGCTVKVVLPQGCTYTETNEIGSGGIKIHIITVSCTADKKPNKAWEWCKAHPAQCTITVIAIVGGGGYAIFGGGSVNGGGPNGGSIHW